MNNKQIELLKVLWSSNDFLRPNKIIEYSSYVLSMFFYKYLSDCAVRLIVSAEIIDPDQVQVAYEKAYIETDIAEEKLRRQLIDENVIDTIIGLPSNLFHYMNIPTARKCFRCIC